MARYVWIATLTASLALFGCLEIDTQGSDDTSRSEDPTDGGDSTSPETQAGIALVGDLVDAYGELANVCECEEEYEAVCRVFIDLEMGTSVPFATMTPAEEACLGFTVGAHLDEIDEWLACQSAVFDAVVECLDGFEECDEGMSGCLGLLEFGEGCGEPSGEVLADINHCFDRTADEFVETLEAVGDSLCECLTMEKGNPQPPPPPAPECEVFSTGQKGCIRAVVGHVLDDADTRDSAQLMVNCMDDMFGRVGACVAALECSEESFECLGALSPYFCFELVEPTEELDAFLSDFGDCLEGGPGFPFPGSG